MVVSDRREGSVANGDRGDGDILRPRELVWAYWLPFLFWWFLFVPQPIAAADSSPPNNAEEARSSVFSSKKGLGITKRRLPDWERRLVSLNIAWYYTWRPEFPGRIVQNIEFVPMLWGRDAVTEENISDLRNGKRRGRYKNLLGFNEPDTIQHSNIDVEDAIMLWPWLESTGLQLGSPATVNAHNPWMRSFISKVELNKGRVDFIALHWYGGPDPIGFFRHLDYVHKRYGRPIWITEFAVADWSARQTGISRFSATQTLDFMRAVLPVLERLDYVVRYAWFSAPVDHPALGQSALFHDDGSLTPLGYVYARF